jgi:rRNA maturation endonuclease Nob1
MTEIIHKIPEPMMWCTHCHRYFTTMSHECPMCGTKLRKNKDETPSVRRPKLDGPRSSGTSTPDDS